MDSGKSPTGKCQFKSPTGWIHPPTPTLDTWDQQMREQIDAIDEDGIFTAHSLGTVAALHYLSRELKQQKIQQLVLIAGFNGQLGRVWMK